MENLNARTDISFYSFMMNIESNVRYMLPDNCRFKWLKIEYNERSKTYSWAMERNFSACGSVGYVYPMKNSSQVSTFKTKKGAKNNLIKKHGEYFKTIFNN